MTNEEQFRQIREGLERLAKESKDKFERGKRGNYDDYSLDGRENVLPYNQHSTEIETINESLKIVCRVYNFPYEPIKLEELEVTK